MRHIGRILGLATLVFVFVSTASGVWAQEEATVDARSTMEAVPTDGPISIDGVLREDAWARATPATDFRQLEPDEGTEGSQRTSVRVLYGEDQLYVGARLQDEAPDRVQATLGRRDELNQADWFLISIDSELDRRQAFVFAVNAAGVQLDARRSGGGGGGPGGGGGGGGPIEGLDTSWDAVWYSEVRRTSDGWVVELQIPYSMLRFPEAETQTWGIHFTRTIPRLGEQSEWPLVPRTERSNLVAQFGQLTGMDGIDPKRNVQVRPYSMTRTASERASEGGDQATWTNTVDVGGDLKVGLGTNSTIDVTVNPDFGQVESDPAVLNLSAFETFFEEKRPFFVEGMDKFEFSVGPGELLYTRRVGAHAPIVGAGKLSGRTRGGYSYGVLGATTGDRFDPTRHYGVSKMEQQIGSYSSVAGIGTAFSGPTGTDGGRRESFSGGGNWDLRFADNRYGIEGFAALTHQRDSVFTGGQRTGAAGKVWFRKRQGTWSGFVGADVFGDQFDPNDLGQLRENNFAVLLTSIDYEINDGQPFGPFQRATIGTFLNQSVTYDDGLDRGLEVNLNSAWVLRTFQRIELSGAVSNPFGGYDQFETRGLGPWAEPASIEVGGEIETDRRRSWQVEPEVEFSTRRDGGYSYTVGLRGNVDVGTRLSLSGNVEGEWERDYTAWSANEVFRDAEGGWEIGETAERTPEAFLSLDDPAGLDGIFAHMDPLSTDPDRYFASVFGERDTRSVDVTLRSTVTFTPQLSLQLYSQLFVAQGQYDDFQILRDRDTLCPFDGYPKQDEFAIQSLQSNVVFRWQYRPGSTLFLVWTHGRRANPRLDPLDGTERSLYDQPFTDHVDDTFDLFGQNTFLLKLNYTFLR